MLSPLAAQSVRSGTTIPNILTVQAFLNGGTVLSPVTAQAVLK